MLEFALTELWERDAGKGVLTLESYESLGYTAPDGRRFPGVQGAIARRAEAVWQDLSDEEQRAARRVFLGLVTPGPVDERGEQTAEDAGRRAWQAEWDAPAQRVVEKLEGDQALRRGLALLPRPVARMEHQDTVYAVAFSPDGHWLATGSEDSPALLWEVATGAEVARMKHEDSVHVVVFSPDGRWLATGSWDGTVRVWAAVSGGEVARMVHEDMVVAMAFSPDGKWLATGSGDGTVSPS